MDSGAPKRFLPEVPSPAARSPFFARDGSANRSPVRSPRHLDSLSHSASGSPQHNFDIPETRSPNPYERSPSVSPTRMPLRRFDTHESAHGSPIGSPVRRLKFAEPTASNIITFSDDDSVNELSSDLAARRPLPVPGAGATPAKDDPFDDGASINSGSTLASDNIVPPKHAEGSINDATGFDEGIEDYDGHSIYAETLSSGDDVPESQPRRNKSFSRKEVKLVGGNLVLDCPVPTKLYSFLPRRDSDEFVYMRYSAVTADPDNFADSGFTIRPAIYERDTEIAVCITMYNEDEILFTRTLHAVFKNIAYLCQRTKSKVWGPNAWKRIVVTIVADGRTKVHPRVLDCLAAMGVYQDGVAKNFVNGEEVITHLFEYTSQVSLTPDMRFQGAEKQIVPVQMIFCLKEHNAKKINSHRWFLNAFCPQLNPNVCMLIDVGTRPSTKTLYHLWKAFDEDSNVGGACGEIKTMTGKFGKSLINPLVAAQNFEYKISNILDKPLESAFGYISVLPGALSAYRWRALQNNSDGTGPLASYFKGEKLEATNAGVFEKNMYLAEDRILCWELVAKENEKWVLKYVKDAKGETDVPEALPEFISQRRRWLNGALFAAIYSQTHFRQIWKTDHSPIRKFFLHVEFLYQFLYLIFTFFSLANFYLAFYFVAGSVAGHSVSALPHGAGLALFLIFKYLCIITICAQFILSLGNRPQGAKGLFTISVICLSCVTAYTTIIGLFFTANTFAKSSDENSNIRVLLTMVVSLVSTYGVYTLMSFLYLDPWHVFTSAIQYFLLLPGYVCTLQIYAFCNTHDVTWGTKGDNEQKHDLGSAVIKKEAGGDIVEIEMPSEQVDIDTGYDNALHSLRERAPVPEPAPSNATVQLDYFREIRTRVVLTWMTGNLLLVMLVTQFFSLDNPGENVYLQVILWSMACFAVFRAMGSFVFLMQHVARKLHKTHHHTTIRIRKLMGREDPEVST